MKNIFIIPVLLLATNVAFGQDEGKYLVPPLTIKKIEPLGSKLLFIHLSMIPVCLRGSSAMPLIFFIDSEPNSFRRWNLMQYGEVPIFYCGLPVCFENTTQKDLYYEKSNSN